MFAEHLLIDETRSYLDIFDRQSGPKIVHPGGIPPEQDLESSD